MSMQENLPEKSNFPTFRRIFPFFFFERCTSKKEVKKVKVIYFIIFIALIIIPRLSIFISDKEGVIVGMIIMFGFLLGLFAKPLLAYITIWAAWKFGLGVGRTALLGIMAILPILVWVSIIIILTQKPQVEVISQSEVSDKL